MVINTLRKPSTWVKNDVNFPGSGGCLNDGYLFFFSPGIVKQVTHQTEFISNVLLPTVIRTSTFSNVVGFFCSNACVSQNYHDVRIERCAFPSQLVPV